MVLETDFNIAVEDLPTGIFNWVSLKVARAVKMCVKNYFIHKGHLY